jgi:hypothetical protein
MEQRLGVAVRRDVAQHDDLPERRTGLGRQWDGTDLKDAPVWIAA